MEGFSCSNCIK